MKKAPARVLSLLFRDYGIGIRGNALKIAVILSKAKNPILSRRFFVAPFLRMTKRGSDK